MAGRLSVSQIPRGRSRYYLAGQGQTKSSSASDGVRGQVSGFRQKVSTVIQQIASGQRWGALAAVDSRFRGNDL